MKADAEAQSHALAREDANEKRSFWKSRAMREAISWFWVILAFLFIEGGIVQARVIPSGSMEKTVLIGDHLIVSRVGYDVGVPFHAVAPNFVARTEAAANYCFPRAAPGDGLSGFY